MIPLESLSRLKLNVVKTKMQASSSSKQSKKSKRPGDTPQWSSLEKKGKQLWPKLDWFQKEAVAFAIHKQSCALYMEQGTGKTWVSFGIVEQLLTNESEGLIVGLLQNLETTWFDQFSKLFPHVNVTRDWEAYKKLPKPKLLLCHYEYLTKHINKFARKTWSWVICDESQRLKNRSSNASRAMRKLRYQSDHKYVLSGTPDDGDLIHYWAQFRFFAPDVFGDNWARFDSEYLVPTGYMGYKRKFNPKKIEKFNKLIEPWVMVVSNEVLGLEAARHVRVPVEMPPHVRAKYDQMEDHLVVELKDQILAAQLPVTKTVKLQQLASGFIYDEEHVVHRISGFRTRRCEKLLERHRGEPVVIFCKYVPEMRSLASLCRRMKLRYAFIRGGRKFKKIRPQVQRDFQAGLYDVVICQIRSGVGIDLYKSHVAIFYSTGHSSIDFQQSKARVYRRGQTEKVVYYYLIVKNSIDEDIQLALKEKRSVSKSILRRMETRLKRRQPDGQSENRNETRNEGSRRRRAEVRRQRPRRGAGDRTRIRSRETP